ncbi:MAG TPA: GspH/FimT family pseudopilin [Candidatus Polarisedimenticolaceae bacterium]|nr:GspH/FimT family pseudopilin [Candidatus Polarisedimenticolaceae bacterium]
MKKQAGMTLIELLIVLAAAAIIATITAGYALPWIAAERVRSAIYDVQTYLQISRIEAVSRNRAVRFVLNTATRQIAVIDSVGTSSTSDDVTIRQTVLPTTVSFARPISGAPVTLTSLGGNAYETIFSSDGSVTSGTGDVSLLGGAQYQRVSVFAAGGTQVSIWRISRWVSGYDTAS